MAIGTSELASSELRGFDDDRHALALGEVEDSLEQTGIAQQGLRAEGAGERQPLGHHIGDNDRCPTRAGDLDQSQPDRPSAQDEDGVLRPDLAAPTGLHPDRHGFGK